MKTRYESPHFIKRYENQDVYVNNIKQEDGLFYIYCDPIYGVDANVVLSSLCDEVVNFSNEIKEEWAQAEERFFDIGYSVGDTPNCLNDHFTMDTLKKVNEIKASIKLALYPAEYSDEEGIPESFYNQTE